MPASRLLAGEEYTDSRAVDFSVGKVCYFTRRSPDKEGENEDSLGIVPCSEHSGVLMVADGLGGSPAGGRASEITIHTLARIVEGHCTDADQLRGAIMDGIEQANQDVIDLKVGAATTIAVVEVNGDRVRSYHAGDSQVLLTGQRGKIKYQTMSHSPVGYAVEAGLIHEEDALYHQERHLISNMVGSHEMRVEVGPVITLAPLDTLVVASDGLFDNLHMEEIVNIIRAGPLQLAASTLADVATRRMTQPLDDTPHKPDDLSFILFRLR